MKILKSCCCLAYSQLIASFHCDSFGWSLIYLEKKIRNLLRIKEKKERKENTHASTRTHARFFFVFNWETRLRTRVCARSFLDILSSSFLKFSYLTSRTYCTRSCSPATIHEWDARVLYVHTVRRKNARASFACKQITYGSRRSRLP